MLKGDVKKFYASLRVKFIVLLCVILNTPYSNFIALTSYIYTTYPVGSYPDGIAIDASGNVWVVNFGDNTITELIGLTKGPQYFPYTGPQFPGGGNF